jgi:hypothetical protein
MRETMKILLKVNETHRKVALLCVLSFLAMC